jgi:DnaJ-class molecular chaperone
MKRPWLPPKRGRKTCPHCGGRGVRPLCVKFSPWGTPVMEDRKCLRCGGKGFL